MEQDFSDVNVTASDNKSDMMYVTKQSQSQYTSNKFVNKNHFRSKTFTLLLIAIDSFIGANSV